MAATPLFDPGPAAVSLRERRRAMEGATEALDGFAERLFEAGSTELEELLGLADELVRRAEAARFSLVAEAHSRGVVAESDAASLTSWVTRRALGARQCGGAGIARAVTALGLPATRSSVMPSSPAGSPSAWRTS